MKQINIEGRRNHWSHQLSCGQQQRAAVTHVVVGNSKLLLADKPTGNLDSNNGKEVMSLFSKLNNEGTSIVMVTHSESDASYAKRIIRLSDGSIDDSFVKMDAKSAGIVT